MFHGFKKTKGVISIFLVIILVPMLTASSLFVDISKMVLAHSVAESAADLSLNTVMTHFDKKLNEYYGLIASAQSMDDAYDTAKDFFVSCMKSQEISEEDASNLTNALNKYLFSNSSEGFSDFLGIYTDEDSPDVEPIKNGNLANPAVFKTQVVEFMKYRGPINAVTSFFDFLKSNSEQLTQMDEITEMTEKKQEFYEAESGLMQTLYELYLLLKQYDEYGISKEYLQEIQDRIKHGGVYETEYKKIHDKFVSDLVNTERCTEQYKATPVPSPGSAKKGNIVYSKNVTITNDDGKKTKVPDINDAFEKLCRAYSAYANQEKSLYTALRMCGACDKNNKCIYCSERSEVYDTQYLAIVGEMMKGNNSVTEFKTATNSLYRAYKDFIATYEETDNNSVMYAGYVDDEILVSKCNLQNDAGLFTGGNEYRVVREKVDYLYNNGVLRGAVSLCNDIENHLGMISEEILKKQATTDVNGNPNRLPTINKIEEINEEISSYTKILNSATETIQSAIEKANEVLGALDSYNTGLDNWDAAANRASLDGAGEIVDTDRNEIEYKRSGENFDGSNNVTLLKNIKADEVQALVDRLTAIQARIGFVNKAVENCKYGSHPIKEFNIAILGDEVEKSEKIVKGSFMNKDITSNRDAFSSIFKTYEDTPLAEKEVEPSNDNDPKIEKGQMPFRDNLYEYFEEAEKKRPSNKTDEQAKEEKEKLKKAGKEDNPDYESGSVGGSANTEISKAQGLPSNGGGKGEKATPTNKLSEISKFVTSLFKDFKATASSAMVNLRDDLLFSDYVMSMFSYDTYEREGVLDYAIEEKDYKLKSVIGWSADMANYSKDWSTNDDPTFHYNKSLRNNPINTSSCFSYGNEVEYILYGGGNAKNKSAAYVNIYAIRFACNLIPVFKECWKSPTIVALATSISSATLGIVPPSAVKLLICLGILAAESAVDLAALRQGIGVKFIKTVGNGGNELFIDVDGWLKKALSGEDSGNKNGAIGTELPYFRYSDYLRFFLILKLLGSGENGVCLRTADVVQVNMAKLLNPGEGKEGNQFSLSKSFVYFKLSANVKVKPLMLSLSINASDANPYTTLSELASFDYEMIRGY